MKDEVDYMNRFTKYWNRPDRAAYLFLTPSFLVLLFVKLSETKLSIYVTQKNF